jgi:hypothetical protein
VENEDVVDARFRQEGSYNNRVLAKNNSQLPQVISFPNEAKG